MDFIGQLWMPIVLGAVFSFLASAAIWMIGPHHKKEYKGAPNEDGVMAALRQGGAQAGGFMFPYADRSDKVAFAAAMKKWVEGPAGMLYIFPKGTMNMGKMMGQQFTFFLVVMILLALVGSRVPLDPAQPARIFKLLFTVSLLTYWIGSIPESIWFGRPWKSFFIQGIDAVIYSAVAAGTFAWLWPG